MMELLLREDIPHLGEAGKVIKVRSGYARNYLIPQKKAVLVTKENLRLIERERAQKLKELEQKKAELKNLAKKINDSTTKIKMKVGEEGKLYGAVTASMIAQAIAKSGFPVEERHIRLEAAIKQLGTFPIRIHLAEDVEATAHIVVIED